MEGVVKENLVALVVPNDGKLFLAELLRRGLPLTGTVRLFSGDLIPSSDTTLPDLTEAGFAGYAPIVLPAWTPAAITPSGSALIASGPVQWISTAVTMTPPVTGYWIEQTDWAFVNRLVGVERFGKAIPLYRANVRLLLTVPMSVDSLF